MGAHEAGDAGVQPVAAGRLGATHLQVDILARASQDPRVGVQADADGVWRLPAIRVCALLVQKGEALTDQLDATITESAARWPVAVLEGEGVHPSLAGHHRPDRVRFAFVVEPDQAVALNAARKVSATRSATSSLDAQRWIPNAITTDVCRHR